MVDQEKIAKIVLFKDCAQSMVLHTENGGGGTISFDESFDESRPKILDRFRFLNWLARPMQMRRRARKFHSKFYTCKTDLQKSSGDAYLCSDHYT